MLSKHKRSYILLLILCSLFSWNVCRAQHYYWFLPPNMVDVQNTALNFTPVNGSTSGQYTHSNAAYDAAGNIYFYVQGRDLQPYPVLEIFDPASIVPLATIAQLPGGYSGFSSDVEIVPIPGQCKKFYVIYASDIIGLTNSYVWYAIVDCGNGSPVVESINNPLNSTSPDSLYINHHIGFAVSQPLNLLNERYLFVQCGSGIERWNIQENGILGGQLIFSPVANYQSLSNELDLYDDGTVHILAWGNLKLNTLQLDVNYVPTYFHVYQDALIFGVEVVSPTRIFTCESTGIKYYEIGVPGANPVSTTNDYTKTELEMPQNGKLMCVNDFGQLNWVNDPTGPLPTINTPLPTFPTVLSNGYSIGVGIPYAYKLPDQVESDPTAYQNFENYIVPTANAGADDAICSGEDYDLTGTGSDYITSSWYQQPGNVLLCSPCTTYHLDDPSVTATYTFVTVSSTNCEASDEMVLTVNPNPTPDLGIDREICIGDPLTIDPCEPGWIYDWDYAGFCLEATCFMTPCSSGNYCINVTDNNGCMGSDCVNLTLVECSPCQITAQFSTSMDIKHCQTVHFFDTSVPDPNTTIVGWLWNFGDGSTSTDQNPVYSYPFNGSYTATLTIYGTDKNGNCCSKTNQKKINITCPCKPAKPSVWISIGSDCNVNFSETSAPAGTTHIIAWRWDFGDGTVGFGQNTSHTYAASGSYNISLTVTAFNGTECCNTDPWTGKVVVSCEMDSCSVNADFNTTIDYGYVDFFNQSTAGPGTSITGYYWDFGDGGTSILENPEHTYYSVGTYTVCLTVFGYAGDQCCSNKYCFQVVITSIAEFQGSNNRALQPGSDDNAPAWLGQNRPNPLTDATTIRCFIPEKSQSATLIVQNMDGKVLDKRKIDQRGLVSIDLSLQNLNDGLYSYSLVVDEIIINTRKMAVMK